MNASHTFSLSSSYPAARVTTMQSPSTMVHSSACPSLRTTPAFDAHPILRQTSISTTPLLRPPITRTSETFTHDGEEVEDPRGQGTRRRRKPQPPLAKEHENTQTVAWKSHKKGKRRDRLDVEVVPAGYPIPRGPVERLTTTPVVPLASPSSRSSPTDRTTSLSSPSMPLLFSSMVSSTTPPMTVASPLPLPSQCVLVPYHVTNTGAVVQLRGMWYSPGCRVYRVEHLSRHGEAVGPDGNYTGRYPTPSTTSPSTSTNATHRSPVGTHCRTTTPSSSLAKPSNGDGAGTATPTGGASGTTGTTPPSPLGSSTPTSLFRSTHVGEKGRGMGWPPAHRMRDGREGQDTASHGLATRVAVMPAATTATLPSSTSTPSCSAAVPEVHARGRGTYPLKDDPGNEESISHFLDMKKGTVQRATWRTVACRLFHVRDFFLLCLIFTMILQPLWMDRVGSAMLIRNHMTSATVDGAATESRVFASLPALLQRDSFMIRFCFYCVLLPVMLLFPLWRIFHAWRRTYVEEICVVAGIGIYMTSYGLWNNIQHTTFIDVCLLRSLVIHDAFCRYQPIFFLSATVESWSSRVVFFSHTLPRLEILLPVLRGMRAVLFGEPEVGLSLAELEERMEEEKWEETKHEEEEE